jgi:hypothetical protein
MARVRPGLSAAGEVLCPIGKFPHFSGIGKPGIGRYTRRASHFPTGYGGIEEYLRALSVYSVAFGATAFSIWLVDARQHPHYRAAFRAAATCVTRAP